MFRAAGWYSSAVATQSSVDWWLLWACLSGNRCVSSEDEGPADKHYWRTSAACHNTGRAAALRHPSASPESGCGGVCECVCVRGGSTITHPREAGYRVHAWSRHLPASAGPRPPLTNRRENAPMILKNALRRVHLLSDAHKPNTHKHTHTHTHIQLIIP